jgi:hypothetical protein
MSDLKHIHNAIIDNPDFNLTVAAKRDRLRCTSMLITTNDQTKVRGERVAMTSVK